MSDNIFKDVLHHFYPGHNLNEDNDRIQKLIGFASSQLLEDFCIAFPCLNHKLTAEVWTQESPNTYYIYNLKYENYEILKENWERFTKLKGFI